MKAGSRTPRRLVLTFAGAASLGALFAMMASPVACLPPLPPQKPDPCDVQIVTLQIYADEMINPNQEELPRPVSVRLYQLTTDTKILNARYDDLLVRDKEILGDQLLKVDEFELFPNDQLEVKFERMPEASILAGVAFFRTPVGQSYKTYYEFPPMPNTPEACAQGAADAAADPAAGKVPQAFPRTEFFLRERKIDNGSEFDPSMFPNATKFKRINLPRASAQKASEQAITPPPPPPK
jgi:type VI secretion system protein VasD